MGPREIMWTINLSETYLKIRLDLSDIAEFSHLIQNKSYFM